MLLTVKGTGCHFIRKVLDNYRMGAGRCVCVCVSPISFAGLGRSHSFSGMTTL